MVFGYMQTEIKWLYQAIAKDARYGHYVNIPERICRCLDYFNVAASRSFVKERLHSYYLFIGVVDDAIDSSQLEAGKEILKQFDNSSPSFNEETKQSCAKLVTEVLKCHISLEIYSTVLEKLEELYQAVVKERQSPTMKIYIEQRKAVGRLTAELSYLLIRPLLESECGDLCRFLQQVGEVGCLVDSVIDLRADTRLGLLGFRPTLKDHLKLTGQTLREGIRISLKHPCLFGLFWEALSDDWFDRLHRRGSCLATDELNSTKSTYPCQRAV